MRRTPTLLAALMCGLAALGGCGEDDASSGATVTVTAPATDVCDNGDGALTDAGFVFVTSPVVGQRVSSGFSVEGCSRTFESNVPWELVDREGNRIASGATTAAEAGDGPGPFTFTVEFTVPRRQIGLLIVREDDPSDGEGFPPKDNRIPLVLVP